MTAQIKTAICLKNEGLLVSLTIGKHYPVVPDAEAAARGFLRIIDESGDDYLFPDEYFCLKDTAKN